MPKRRLKGKVVSDKMIKTVVVSVDRVFAHPAYKKRVKVTNRYKAQDDSGAKVGDEVVIEETKPISKEKRWQVIIIGGEPVAKKIKKEEKESKPEKTSRKKKGKKGRVKK